MTLSLSLALCSSHSHNLPLNTNSHLYNLHRSPSDDELRQKLMDATLELETLKNIKTELSNLLDLAYQERDEARSQLQKLMNQFMPSSPTKNLQNMFGEVFPAPTTNAISSISESISLSHGSPPVDSFFDNTVSSPELSNINNAVIDSNNNNNISYLNQLLIQQDIINYTSQKPSCDPADAYIDSLAKGRALPQKGKLLQAVMDAGPLLKTVLLAGPLPTWRNPPPLQQQIKFPPLSTKDYANTTGMEMMNSMLTPKMVPSSLNSISTCSASMLNFEGHTSGGSLNNAWQLMNNSGYGRVRVPLSKRQRHC